jgi:hypothetical protein
VKRRLLALLAVIGFCAMVGILISRSNSRNLVYQGKTVTAWLLQFALSSDPKAHAEAFKPLRLTPAALAAKVESLRITFAQWHTELKPERQAAILKEAFGGAV